MSTTTLSTTELAELLDVTERQLRYVTAGPGKAYARAFGREQIRRFQVASSLAHAIPNSGTNLSAFPIAVRAVLDNPDEPEPHTWAILTAPRGLTTLYGAVSYVHYRADLAGAVGEGGVVVQISKLWPDG
jgi:hypothetical protein